MVLTQEAQYYLQQAGKWATFLGIVGYIVTGFLLLAAIFASALMSYMQKISPSPSPFNMGPFLSILYLIIAVFYFFFSLYLHQFGTNIKKGIAFIDTSFVTTGLGKLKSLFKLWGILTVVMLSIYALIFVGAIVGGIIAATMRH